VGIGREEGRICWKSMLNEEYIGCGRRTSRRGRSIMRKGQTKKGKAKHVKMKAAFLLSSSLPPGILCAFSQAGSSLLLVMEEEGLTDGW